MSDVPGLGQNLASHAPTYLRRLDRRMDELAALVANVRLNDREERPTVLEGTPPER